jgi:hypothetical protein
MKVGKREDLEHGLAAHEEEKRIQRIEKLLRERPIGHERRNLLDSILDAKRKLGR